MKKIVIITAFIWLKLAISPCLSQDPAGYSLPPYGLKPGEWSQVQKIWSRNTHPVTAYKKDLTSVNGQLIFITDKAACLWTDTVSFLKPSGNAGRMIQVPSDSIKGFSADEMLFDRLMTSSVLWGTAAGASLSTALFFIGGGWVSPVIVLAPAIAGTVTGGLISLKNKKEDTGVVYIHPGSGKERERFVMFPSGVNEEFNPDELSGTTFRELMESSPAVKRVFTIPKLSFTWQTGLARTDYNSNAWLITGGFTFRYRPLKWLNAGFSSSNAGSLGTPLLDYTDNSAGLSFYENLSMKRYTLSAEYIPLSFSRFMVNRFELAGGAGVSLNQVMFSTSVFNAAEGNTLIAGEDSKKCTAGLEIMSGVDFYIFRHLSLSMVLKKSFSSPVRPADLPAVSPLTGESVSFPVMEADPSSFDIVFGLRIHFF